MNMYAGITKSNFNNTIMINDIHKQDAIVKLNRKNMYKNLKKPSIKLIYCDGAVQFIVKYQ